MYLLEKEKIRSDLDWAGDVRETAGETIHKRESGFARSRNLVGQNRVENT